MAMREAAALSLEGRLDVSGAQGHARLQRRWVVEQVARRRRGWWTWQLDRSIRFGWIPRLAVINFRIFYDRFYRQSLALSSNFCRAYEIHPRTICRQSKELRRFKFLI